MSKKQYDNKALSKKEIVLYTLGILISSLIVSIMLGGKDSKHTRTEQQTNNSNTQELQRKLDTLAQYKLSDPKEILTTEPNTTYHLLSLKPIAQGEYEIITRQKTTNFTSYSRKKIYCSDNTFQYLGDGDTLIDAMKDIPSKRAPIVDGSSASKQLIFVCSLNRVD